MCAGAEELCSLKQEALALTPLDSREHAVAWVACSAGEHRGEARHQSSHASKSSPAAASGSCARGEKNLSEQTAHTARW